MRGLLFAEESDVTVESVVVSESELHSALAHHERARAAIEATRRATSDLMASRVPGGDLPLIWAEIRTLGAMVMRAVATGGEMVFQPHRGVRARQPRERLRAEHVRQMLARQVGS